jgi:hypothetical protein
MQRLVNLIAGLMVLVGVCLVGGWRYRNIETGHRAEELKEAVVRLKREVDRRAAMVETSKSEQGWPSKIDPEWFDDAAPRNFWVTGGRPWVEIAAEGQEQLMDPVVRAVDEHVGAELAEFWYNPANGNVRARVPSGASDRETLALYNKVNATSLDSLFETPEWRSASAGAK